MSSDHQTHQSSSGRDFDPHAPDIVASPDRVPGRSAQRGPIFELHADTSRGQEHQIAKEAHRSRRDSAPSGQNPATRQPGRVIQGIPRLDSGQIQQLRQQQQQQASISEDDDSDGGVPLPSANPVREEKTDIEDVPHALRHGIGSQPDTEHREIDDDSGVESDPSDELAAVGGVSLASPVSSGVGDWMIAFSTRQRMTENQNQR